MTEKTVQIENKIGLHARPASLLVTAAGRFKSNIVIKKGDRTAAANSMIKILALRVKLNDTITIEADGSDEEQAVETLAELIHSKFGEE